ncbi:MAG: ATP-binding protein [Chloroflexota bacterium]|nr:ATP-binding protein [Chloroflexota bacterium]
MNDFFDREREMARLERVWQEPGAQLVTVWGRRRVGKSALLSRFVSGKRAVYLHGTRLAERDLLINLTNQMATAFGEEHLRFAPFATWDLALQYLATKAGDERLLIIFDEFPYMCDVTQGLDTVVQHWWDSIHQTQNLMLVVAGSAFSFMEGLTGICGALHGRRTGQLDVHPFDYYDAARFFTHLDSTDKVRAYACLGGVPAYLRYARDDWTVSDLIQQAFMRPGHFLFTEGEDLLRTEFHQEGLYASILRAVANGEVRPSDIARTVGRPSLNDITDHLRRLLDLRFLQREVPVTELNRTRTQRVQYRLADPYLRFWFRFISVNQSLVLSEFHDIVWNSRIAPFLDEFVARTAWEEICTQYLWRALSRRQLPALFSVLGRWWDGNDEIDMVGMLDGAITIVGECKWSVTPVDIRVFDNLRRKMHKLDATANPFWVLASRSGFEPEVRRRAEQGDLLLIEPDYLFDPELERPV